MSFTAQNICDEAFILIRFLQAGRTASATQYQVALDALNQLVDTASADGATIYQLTRELFALSGTAPYTMGPSGTFNTARPEKIRAAAVIAANGSMPCEVVSVEKFSTIIDRPAMGAFADFLACDYDYPLANIYLWPSPATGTLELWSYKPLTAFAALTTPVSFPPGYLEFLKFNLAVNLASMFAGSKLDQTTLARAQVTRAGLGALNAVTIGNAAPPVGPAPAQQPLTATDIEKGKAAA